jgi:outer membrane protein assembly factor BamA
LKKTLHIFCFFSVFLFASGSLSAQDTNRVTRGQPVPRSEFLYEIQDVQFNGNKFFGDDELFAVIDSRNTDLGFFQFIIRYYAERVKRNRAAPSQMKQAFDNVLRDMQGEIQYFNQEVANRDARAIEHLYNKSGFHWTKVTYRYGRDSTTLIKTLTFDVVEGDQALLDTVVYAGIDSLPQPVLNDVLKTRTQAPGSIYSEEAIQKDINSAYKVLQDSGYFYATFSQPVTTVLSETKSDSVFTAFTTGKRQRISKIIITDSLEGQSVVSYNMKRMQLEFKEGEWYNRSAVERSINNLYELTTFDVVLIDTIADGDFSDTTISLQVLLRYRKQQQFSPAFTVNQTTIDKFVNAGFDFTYTHRNIGGAAQNLTAFFRPQLLNISRIADQALEAAFSDTIDFRPENIDWELQTGFQISQPYLWTWDFFLGEPRVSGSFNYLFSYRYLVRPLQLRTHFWRPTLTANFPKPMPWFGWVDDIFGLDNIFRRVDVYDQAILDLSFESQRPFGYDSTVRYLQQVSSGVISRPENERALIENLHIYKVLNERYEEDALFGFLTSIIPSVTLIADRRDDFFTPTTGYYSTFSFDYGFLISQFSRVQGLLTIFQKPGENLVLGYKLRAGNIFWRNPNTSYVPFEKHFFAGGSNSVRGWPSRELRAPIPSDSIPLTQELRILRDIVGSATLLEGSFEARWNFGRQGNYFLSSIISEMGAVAFLDWGTTFDRLSNTTYGLRYSFFPNFGVSPGVGIRYNTPVGPLRLDVATRLYDPAMRSSNFKHIQVHIGLGHAF